MSAPSDKSGCQRCDGHCFSPAECGLDDLDLDTWQDPQPDEDTEGQIWADQFRNTL